MPTQVIYSGVDITKSITVTSCIMTDSNGGKQDYCKLTFANGGKLWQEWKPQYNDKVRVKHGYSDSGVMFINGISSDNKSYTLILLSTPTTAKKRKNRIWRDVKLSEIISDVSNGLGFKVQFYGFTDYTYKSVSQKNKTDLEFMCEMCSREGYNVKLYNENIIIYDEKSLYFADASGTITPSDCNFYEFDDQNAPLSALTVKYYDISKRELIEYTSKAEDVDGGSDTLIIRVDNQGQAERFSKNILRHNNNFIQCGILRVKNADNFACGSVLNLSEFSEGNNGKWYVNECIFDTTNNDCMFNINRIRG